MGLLYPFPVSPEEKDFAQWERGAGPLRLTLKTYGLPYIFWGYAFASLSALFFLWLAVHPSLEKLVAMGDSTDWWLVRSLQVLLVLVPLATLSAFFYEKRLIVQDGVLCLQHRFFGITLRQRHIRPTVSAPFSVRHHLDAANVARLKGGEEAIGFQNKGYFVLYAHSSEGESLMLDRHSRKTDLLALEKMLREGLSETVNHAQ